MDSFSSARASCDVEVAVIGAGVVGLAVATYLAEAGLETLVVERHEGPGRETTSRNSEVVHAGIYYEPGSLKARLCVRGRALLYDFCRSAGIAHKRLGKLIIATSPGEMAQLSALKERGEENGAGPLTLLGAAEVTELEPALSAEGALLSPESGIVEAHGLVKALEARLAAAGGLTSYSMRVDGISPRDGGGYALEVTNPTGREELTAAAVVNAAGLEADRIAALVGLGGDILHWCRGDYVAVGGRSQLVARLIYPVPGARLTGLGVHVTLDLAGQLRLGPDATYVNRDAPQGDVDPAKVPQFWTSVRRYLPDIPLDRLRPDTWGIRPKLQGPGDPWRDFVIREESARGYPGLVNLIGIESPGLTAALAIGEYVQTLLLPETR